MQKNLILFSILLLILGSFSNTVLAISFEAMPTYKVGDNPMSINTGDFNGDGKIDLAVANGSYHSQSVSILLGNGDGTFSPAVDYNAGSVPYSVSTGDFNGDGKSDLAIADSGSCSVSILLGNGDGTFGPAAHFNTGSVPSSIITGDFNGDSKTDVAVANGGTYTTSILIGNGDGTFDENVSYEVGTSPTSLTTGDFNGDGNADLAVASGYGNTVSILLGKGDGTFNAAVYYIAGFSPWAVTIGDFNADGREDLAIANYRDDNVSILIGKGDGTFGTAVNYDVVSFPTSLFTGDFDRDGTIDLAVANSNSNNVSILLGIGDGTFQKAIDYGAGDRPVSIVTGDFNGDGKIDLAVANSNSNNVSVLINATPIYTLTISHTGSGTGTITSNPSGIGCGADCSEKFNENTTIILTATPEAGSLFSGWTEDCASCGINTDCNITVDGDKTCSVTFTITPPINYYTITISKTGTGSGTITSNPSGINCGNDCSNGYSENTVVTLTATPDAGAMVAEWIGDCVGCGTNANCNITMDKDKACTATFTIWPPINYYTITVSKTGTGSGTITSNPSGINCGNDCIETYNEKIVSIMTATPSSGSLFAGWTGDCSACGTNSDCNIAMDKDKTCTATFNLAPPPNYFTLTVTKSGTGDGIVTSTPAGINCGTDCSDTYQKTTKPKNMKLKIKPDAYATFLGWGGVCQGQGTKTTCTVKMDSDKSVTASFGLPDISVSPDSYDFGSVAVKKTSSPATFTIQNNGTGNLKVTKIKVIGTDAKMFRIKGGSKKTVAPGGNYSFTVTFKPTSAGTKSATLQILSNDPDSPTIEVPLSGNEMNDAFLFQGSGVGSSFVIAFPGTSLPVRVSP
jgi:hypothetical protein